MQKVTVNFPPQSGLAVRFDHRVNSWQVRYAVSWIDCTPQMARAAVDEFGQLGHKGVVLHPPIPA